MADAMSDFIRGDYERLPAQSKDRIIARRQRLARRLENIKRINLGLDSEIPTEVEEEAKTISQQQVEKSAELLEKLVLESEELITNVRVANDGREVDRRENEGVVKEKILEQLEEEAEAAQEMFNEIAGRWSDIYKYSDPLAIHEELMGQKEKCDELIKQKDGIIAMLKDDVKRTERQFSCDQTKQNEDIETLTRRIEDQVILMRKAYNTELNMMENVILLERKILIDSNNEKWDDLYNERDDLEKSNIELRLINDQKHIRHMIQLRITHEELYRKTRISLENDINHLNQQLEIIKSLCLINSEKLDYNYQILAKREDENLIIKSQQKRRINKLQDIINDYRKKITEYTAKSSSEVKRLTEQVKNLRKGVKDTENKLEHFSRTNDAKYNQIWRLNFKNAEALLQKILKVDRILYEQQLGKEWKIPEFQLLTKMHLRSYQNAVSTLDVKAESQRKLEAGTNTEQGTEDFTKSNKYTPSTYDKSYIQKNKYLHRILKLISDKSGFLVESRLKVILREYDADRRYLVRIGNLFSALGVESKKDVEDLTEFFLPYSQCQECEISSLKSSEREIKVEFYDGKVVSDDLESNISDHVQEALNSVHEPNNRIEEILEILVPQEEDPSKVTPSVIDSKITTNKSSHKPNVVKVTCPKQHPLVVNPGFVLRALSEFMKNYYVTHGIGPSDVPAGTDTTKNATVSRLLTDDDVLLFWNRFKEVFNPAKDQLWNGLLFGLQKYLDILKDRRKMNDEVIALRKQNLELKHLLGTYVEQHKKRNRDRAPKDKIKAPCSLAGRF